MKTRGRKTAGDLEVVDATQRPEPPKRMPKEQKEIWERCVDALPADWFRPETLDLLEEYCQQVTTSRRVAKMIDKVPMDASGIELQRLVRMKEKTGRMIITLATKMRLTQQSSYDKTKLKSGQPPATDPWLTLV